jgi:hypothetical protein
MFIWPDCIKMSLGVGWLAIKEKYRIKYFMEENRLRYYSCESLATCEISC